MALAYGIRIAVNGSETDVDVENDSADWTEKIGNVKHRVGGGSWLRPGNPGVLQFDAMIPMELARKVRTITVAVSCDATTGSTLSAPYIGTGTGAYRIIFHGDIVSLRATVEGLVQFDAASEMSGLMNRTARVAAETTAGYSIRALLTDIETSHSLTMGGASTFPQGSTYWYMNRPAQKKNTNGAAIRGVLAGSGINMSEEWGGSITAPELRWRADYQDAAMWTVTTSYYRTTEVGYPWLLSYDDIGVQWQDFNAKLVVTGENWEGTVSRWASCRLALSGQRNKCGNREMVYPTWLNTETYLKESARYLMGHQGEPNWIKMNQVSMDAEVYYRAVVAGPTPLTGDDAEEVLNLTAAMPGDVLTARGYHGLNNWTSSSYYSAWPTDTPAGGAVSDALESLWIVDLTNDADTETCEEWVIRAVTREWRPTGGWKVTYGLDPNLYLPDTAFPSGDVNSDTGEYG